MKEIWKDVVGYEGLYKVSDLGRIFSVKTSRIIKQRKTNKSTPYFRVTLSKKGESKTFYVHRLVAFAFIQKIEGKNFVDHINSCSLDNNASNLRWCTSKENSNFPIVRSKISKALRERKSVDGLCLSEETKSKISEAKGYRVLQVGFDGVVVNCWRSARYAQKITKITKITDCCNGKIVSAKGYIWVYEKDKSSLDKRINEAKKFQRKFFVEQYTLDGDYVKTWGNISEVERVLNIRHVRECCAGVRKSSGGYKWIHPDGNLCIYEHKQV